MLIHYFFARISALWVTKCNHHFGGLIAESRRIDPTPRATVQVGFGVSLFSEVWSRPPPRAFIMHLPAIPPYASIYLGLDASNITRMAASEPQRSIVIFGPHGMVMPTNTGPEYLEYAQ